MFLFLFRKIPHRDSYKLEDCDNRRKWVEKVTTKSLSNVGQWLDPQSSLGFHPTESLGGNIENLIGLAKIPLGVIGPLLIKGDHVNEHILCPFATTEGTLVASSTRGATAMTRSGGVSARVIQRRIMRTPHFVTDSMQQAQELSSWLISHFEELKSKASEVSQHCKLIGLEPWFVGRNLLMEFVYDSADAAGQNGVTVTTWHACQWALEQITQEQPHINIREFYIETKCSGDKGALAKNYIKGRGTEVQAEAYITESVLQNVLKVDSSTLYRCFHAFQMGAQRSGSYCLNICVSNTIAGISAATGQDLACVHESSWAVLEIAMEKEIKVAEAESSEKYEPGIYASLVIPTLLIGTVGGGTGTPTAKECLDMIGCFGKGRVYRFAEIIASFALAMELSTLSAIASGQFASAHERFGRNRPEYNEN
ncbi:unnamed protein product [Porites evermanni]|uniref:hydroxymethylglutaryl-CoA reductase (NADPH) n=1 Tax=Porites evermanni TaxID=104178 RepID=A0ABN8S9P5_9CNID|nr:unnamed protein product [Porites evermanni]